MKRFLVPFLAALALSLAIAAVPVPAAAPVVCGSRSLTAEELNYYYQSEYLYVLDAYGEYLQLEQELSPQWLEFLKTETLSVVWDTLSMVQAAEAEGFSLPTDRQQEFDSLWNGFLAAADGDMAAYLQASYGPGAAEDTFRTYLYDAHVAAAYADHLYDGICPTDAQIEEQVQDRGGVYLDEGLDPSLWRQQAEQELIPELFALFLDELRARYPLTGTLPEDLRPIPVPEETHP